MAIGILTLHLFLPGCTSLKEKRSRIKPLIHRLHREFNISVAEMDRQDMWKETVIACAQVSSDTAVLQGSLQKVTTFVEISFPDLQLVQDQIEII
jgi:uncharacterized protein